MDVRFVSITVYPIFEMTSVDFVFSFSGTPIIATTKLNWTNNLSWSGSIDLWFLSQGYHNHLGKEANAISTEDNS